MKLEPVHKRSRNRSDFKKSRAVDADRVRRIVVIPPEEPDESIPEEMDTQEDSAEDAAQTGKPLASEDEAS